MPGVRDQLVLDTEFQASGGNNLKHPSGKKEKRKKEKTRKKSYYHNKKITVRKSLEKKESFLIFIWRNYFEILLMNSLIF